ncbi:MAG: DUF3892 domain-containing protein [Myxococcales bacterium]
MRWQITCTDKDAVASSHESITHVGGIGFRFTQEEAIERILKRHESFFTREDGKTAEVEVREGRYGKCLQTKSDGVWTNNLLALNACRYR